MAKQSRQQKKQQQPNVRGRQGEQNGKNVAAACAANDKREPGLATGGKGISDCADRGTGLLPRVACDEICMLSCVKQSYDRVGAAAAAEAAGGSRGSDVVTVTAVKSTN